MFEFFKSKMVYNSRMEFIVNFLKKIIAIFRIFAQSFTEIKDVLFVCKKIRNDKDFLGYAVRRNAHILEKLIKNLDKGFKYSVVYGQMIANDLKNSLNKWEQYNYGRCETIQWARKIQIEYQRLRESKFTCTQIGKVNFNKANSDLLTIMKNRRSVRQWKNEPVPTEKVMLLIDAARWAPSSCNRQTCHFIIVDEKEVIETIGKSVKGAKYFFNQAPLLIIVLNDIGPYSLPEEKYIVYQDAAAAIQNILLMASKLQLGACWGAYTSGSNIILNEKRIRNLLKIPHCYKITGIIAIGVASELPCPIPRKNGPEIICLNKYV